MAHTESSEKKTTATLTIDGRQVTVPVGATILEAAAELGIKIPTLCWLKKVSTTGACRICVVAVEGIDRLMTACNTPVKDGITVTTTSPEIIAARQKTLELLLVNHPLDCPVCDAAGECDLQDIIYAHEVDRNRYAADLERLPIRYDWKLLESDPNRCVLCEKCVKVCREVVGREAIEIVDRGDRTIIDTVSGEPLDCDFCGNCINVCPTGTLISKPFKFKGRPWTFNVTPSVCTFCSSGCQIDYHSANGRVERVTSGDDTYNRGILCINGRFGYAAFNSPERITSPLVAGEKAGWDKALATVAGTLKEIIAANGGNAVAGIGSPRVTNEESYLFQKFLRGAVGTNSIDSEARLGFLPSQIIQYEMLGYSGGTRDMNAIEKATAVVVIGADLKGESPGYAYKMIQASTKNNAKVVMAFPRLSSTAKYANAYLQYKPGSEAWLVAGLNKALIEAGAGAAGSDTLKSSLDALSFEKITQATGIPEAKIREAAALACAGGSTAVIYGSGIIRSADMKNAVTGCVNLALLTGATGENGVGIYPLDEKNNTQGMLDMGVCPEYLPGYHAYGHVSEFGDAWNCAVPAAPGKDLFGIIDGIEKGEIKALYVMGSDPLQFMPDRGRVLNALKKLDLLVVQDLFPSETAKLAHVFLPAATAAEKSGSFTAVDNRVQCFSRAVAPAGEAKNDAEILQKLFSLVAPVAPIAVQGSEELHHEITRLTKLYTETCDHAGCRMGRIKNRAAAPAACRPLLPSEPAPSGKPFTLVCAPIQRHNGSYTTWSASNNLVAPGRYLEINPSDAQNVGVSQGDQVTLSTDTGSKTLPVRISSAVAPGTLFVPSNFGDGVLSGAGSLAKA